MIHKVALLNIIIECSDEQVRKILEEHNTFSVDEVLYGKNCTQEEKSSDFTITFLTQYNTSFFSSLQCILKTSTSMLS